MLVQSCLMFVPGALAAPFLSSLALLLIGSGNAGGQVSRPRVLPPRDVIAGDSNPAIEWNQIFVDSLIATNTANSSSQRLGAIVHAAIFDAYNGIERRYSPVFIQDPAPRGASRRAAVIAAAYTALATLFPTQRPMLDNSLCCFPRRIERR